MRHPAPEWMEGSLRGERQGGGSGGGGRKVRLCLSVSSEGVRGGWGGKEEMGMFCPVALDLLVTQKREKKKGEKESG